MDPGNPIGGGLNRVSPVAFTHFHVNLLFETSTYHQIMDAHMPDWGDFQSISQSEPEAMDKEQEPDGMEDVEQTTVVSTSPSSGDASGTTVTPTGNNSSPSPNDDEIPTLRIPPKQTAFDSFEKLCQHLSQSDLIFDSFKELYGTS